MGKSSSADSIKYWDQDVLNAVLCEQKVLMPIKYNLQRNFLLKKKDFDYWKVEKELKEALADPCIVHYTTKYKPWKIYQDNPHPFNSMWDKYQEMTKWKGIKYDCRTMKQRFKSFVVSILRKAGVAPVSKKSVYVDVAPVD